MGFLDHFFFKQKRTKNNHDISNVTFFETNFIQDFAYKSTWRKNHLKKQIRN